jgi:hypothetical protein
VPGPVIRVRTGHRDQDRGRVTPVIACLPEGAQACGMDRPKRRNMLLDLRAIDDKVRLWLGAGDMDEDDRQALQTVRDLISDLISRPGPVRV